MAIAQGACTLAPNGERITTRQSPISSRKRWTTMVWSDGRIWVDSRLFLQIVDEVGGRPLTKVVTLHEELPGFRGVQGPRSPG